MIVAEIYFRNDGGYSVDCSITNTVTNENNGFVLQNSWSEMEGNISIYFGDFILDHGSVNVFRLFKDSTFTGEIFTEDNNFLYDLDNTYFLDRDSLFEYFEIVISSPPSVLPSLNGNGCEYSDGELVTVATRSETFKVLRSFFIMLSDNTYSPCYDLESIDGLKTLSSPEGLMASYVAPVGTGG